MRICQWNGCDKKADVEVIAITYENLSYEYYYCELHYQLFSYEIEDFGFPLKRIEIKKVEA